MRSDEKTNQEKIVSTVGTSALVGGLTSTTFGGDFWDGARNGAISAGLNHLAHSLQEVNPERLKARILKDGRLTLKEANQWYRHGKGNPLTVDASKVDLDFVNPDGWTVNQTKGVQTLYQSRDGRVYGNLTLTYKGGDQFKIHSDNYGFEMHTGSGASTWFRNQFTKIGGYVAGEGLGYDIHFNGYNTVNYAPYTPNYPTGYKW